MDRQPLVSIVIPTYNRARDLERALRSVVAQTYSRWETLIVDNHSADHTDEVVGSFKDSRMKLIKIHNRGVIAASRNAGIKHAQGEYVAFLDSDDWWHTRKLARSIHVLERGADVVYHDMFLATKPGQRIFWRKARTHKLERPVFDDLIATGRTLNTSSVVARRKLLEEIYGFSEDPSLVAAEDFDAWLRAAKVTDRFCRIDQTLGYYWAGGGNMSDPRRTLMTMTTLERRYADAIRGLGDQNGVYWINYGKGRAHYRMGSNVLAKRYLELLRWRRTPFSMSMKRGWMLLSIKFPLRSIGKPPPGA